ncbi:anthranilate synthase component II [Pseudonocardia asaccharolytica]|uniref:Glutamine amidotransferase n=1 Tax=Pseudonocardia asaccharolytica DSM 44247 = NBRC 16224 TaxID=1123024 RepID=A0A511D654_9PSEU|nr:aminodeoxychorismate/anthranilate synthase component II [Pseudonocardia asaccharolytica]GEL20269.1 glutamine amidotransferase [Pseudonocardia asaccharolytica DSM 44247 = NBRC 16224]
MICVIDNYDSFVYNLVQYVGDLGADCVVHRNDEVTVEQIVDPTPELIIISPGPGDPADAGISVELVRRLGHHVPIFGVCLGHQVIGAAFGARIRHAAEPMHGKCSEITHDGRGVFAGLRNPLTVARYHSLVIEADTLPAELVATAWSAEGEIMGVRHRSLPIEGVQFHPESLFTEQGLDMVGNAVRGICSGVSAQRLAAV